MKSKLFYIFTISLILGMPFTTVAQEKAENNPQSDSIIYKERYGLRLGLDLSKPIRSFIDNKYNGFEIKGDYRLTKRFFPAAELGHESYISSENNFEAKSTGSYAKIGVNYNTYKNWIGMQNEIYAGLRYGFSSFSEKLNGFIINDRDHYFPSDIRLIDEEFKNLSAHWIEFQIGIKTEVLNNLYLGIHAELKRIVSEKDPDNFSNLWIPGYNRNYNHSAFGIGWGYSISYLIPITKKVRIEKQ